MDITAMERKAIETLYEVAGSFSAAMSLELEDFHFDTEEEKRIFLQELNVCHLTGKGPQNSQILFLAASLLVFLSTKKERIQNMIQVYNDAVVKFNTSIKEMQDLFVSRLSEYWRSRGVTRSYSSILSDLEGQSAYRNQMEETISSVEESAKSSGVVLVRSGYGFQTCSMDNAYELLLSHESAESCLNLPMDKLPEVQGLARLAVSLIKEILDSCKIEDAQIEELFCRFVDEPAVEMPSVEPYLLKQSQQENDAAQSFLTSSDLGIIVRKNGEILTVPDHVDGAVLSCSGVRKILAAPSVSQTVSDLVPEKLVVLTRGGEMKALVPESFHGSKLKALMWNVVDCVDLNVPAEKHEDDALATLSSEGSFVAYYNGIPCYIEEDVRSFTVCDGYYFVLRNDGSVFAIYNSADEPQDSFTQGYPKDCRAVVCGRENLNVIVCLKEDGTLFCDIEDAVAKFFLEPLKNWKGVVQVLVLEGAVYGLFADGSVKCCAYDLDSIDAPPVEIPDGVLAMGNCDGKPLFILRDGTVFFDGGVLWDGEQLFRNPDHLLELDDAMKEEDIELRGCVAKEKLQIRWRSENRCQWCGGAFKGLFKKVCRECGREKDY